MCKKCSQFVYSLYTWIMIMIYFMINYVTGKAHSKTDLAMGNGVNTTETDSYALNSMSLS